MKFSYPELIAEMHEGKRYYCQPNGMFYPSITTVLGTTMPQEKVKSLEGWRQSLGAAKADAYAKSRADHGTNVHLLAERFLKNEDVNALIDGASVPIQDMIAFNALKLKLKNVQEVWGQEVALYSEHFEVAGRCDLIGVWKDKPVIIDFKTSARLKSQEDIYDYRLQLAFYGHAHNEIFGTTINDGVVLMVAANGFPLEFNFKLDEYFEPLQKRIEEFWITILKL